MVDLILDTNIYGKIIIDKNSLELIDKIVKSGLVVHNFELIREELRKTSKTKKIKRAKTRTTLLNAYDAITTNKRISENKKMAVLADRYFREYRKLGGGVSRKNIISDFKIVACASVKGFDIIVSDDDRTMKSKNSMSAYNIINLQNKLRSPNFLSYNQMKTSLLNMP